MEHDSEKDSEEPFEFPMQILDSISECSPDGFILFVINDEGEIELFSRSQVDVIESGLRTKALKILSGLSMLEDNEIASNIFRQKNNPNQIGPIEDGSEDDQE